MTDNDGEFHLLISLKGSTRHLEHFDGNIQIFKEAEIKHIEVGNVCYVTEKLDSNSPRTRSVSLRFGLPFYEENLNKIKDRNNNFCIPFPIRLLPFYLGGQDIPSNFIACSEDKESHNKLRTNDWRWLILSSISWLQDYDQTGLIDLRLDINYDHTDDPHCASSCDFIINILTKSGVELNSKIETHLKNEVTGKSFSFDFSHTNAILSHAKSKKSVSSRLLKIFCWLFLTILQFIPILRRLPALCFSKSPFEIFKFLKSFGGLFIDLGGVLLFFKPMILYFFMPKTVTWMILIPFYYTFFQPEPVESPIIKYSIPAIFVIGLSCRLVATVGDLYKSKAESQRSPLGVFSVVFIAISILADLSSILLTFLGLGGNAPSVSFFRQPIMYIKSWFSPPIPSARDKLHKILKRVKKVTKTAKQIKNGVSLVRQPFQNKCNDLIVEADMKEDQCVSPENVFLS